jgi:peptide-methionine (R)-S-oxide reductase
MAHLHLRRNTKAPGLTASLPAVLAGTAEPALGFAKEGTEMANLFGGIQRSPKQIFPVSHSEAEWRELLSPQQFAVLRGRATERPGSSPLHRERRAGRFSCAGCRQQVFDSAAKFESGTGWPSFTAPLADAVGTEEDRSLFAARTEVHCARCGGHLGHVFTDGPAPTGLRYCINGAALRFDPA